MQVPKINWSGFRSLPITTMDIREIRKEKGHGICCHVRRKDYHCKATRPFGSRTSVPGDLRRAVSVNVTTSAQSSTTRKSSLTGRAYLDQIMHWGWVPDPSISAV